MKADPNAKAKLTSMLYPILHCRTAREILMTLSSKPDETWYVTKLKRTLKSISSPLTQVLNQLEQAGLITTEYRRCGRTVRRIVQLTDKGKVFAELLRTMYEQT